MFWLPVAFYLSFFLAFNLSICSYLFIHYLFIKFISYLFAITKAAKLANNLKHILNTLSTYQNTLLP